jgi:hypothetical protein
MLASHPMRYKWLFNAFMLVLMIPFISDHLHFYQRKTLEEYDVNVR